MNEWIKWITVPAALSPCAVYATQYLSVEQAQRALFPAATQFAVADVKLTPEQAKAIEQQSGVRVREAHQRIWRVQTNAQTLGWFMVDEVYGKHEFITYALALNAGGAVQGIEILDYRETYGGEVRDAKWREQFRGKTAADPLKLDQDIKNISGATLSCRHIADGVRRLLALHKMALS